MRMEKSKSREKFSLYHSFYRILYTLSFLALIYFAVDGYSFYSTSYSQRPRHELYRELRPAGNYGHAFGIIGSTMMIFMLLYTVRKRSKLFGRVGRLSGWLDLHIYFGVIGPLLVILHTSFKVQGLVAVSFWSMIAVAGSGVFGRYLYLQIPRDVGGEQLSANELDELKGKFTEQLSSEIQLEKSQLEMLEKDLAADSHKDAGLIRSLWFLITSDLFRPIRRRMMRRRYRSKFKLPAHLHDQVFQIFWEKALLNRKIAFLNQVQTLFHYWHVFHKPFAIIMYLVMLIHVVVAVWLGYVWIF